MKMKEMMMKKIYYTNDIPKTLVKIQAKSCRKNGMKEDTVQFQYVDMLDSILTGKIMNADLVVCSPIYYRRLKLYFMEHSIAIPVCRYHWTRGRYYFPEEDE